MRSNGGIRGRPKNNPATMLRTKGLADKVTADNRASESALRRMVSSCLCFNQRAIPVWAAPDKTALDHHQIPSRLRHNI